MIKIDLFFHAKEWFKRKSEMPVLASTLLHFPRSVANWPAIWLSWGLQQGYWENSHSNSQVIKSILFLHMFLEFKNLSQDSAKFTLWPFSLGRHCISRASNRTLLHSLQWNWDVGCISVKKGAVYFWAQAYLWLAVSSLPAGCNSDWRLGCELC